VKYKGGVAASRRKNLPSAAKAALIINDRRRRNPTPRTMPKEKNPDPEEVSPLRKTPVAVLDLSL
jgi:hypothetical protein